MKVAGKVWGMGIGASTGRHREVKDKWNRPVQSREIYRARVRVRVRTRVSVRGRSRVRAKARITF